MSVAVAGEDRLSDLVELHCAAEVAQDIDAVMATVCPDPHFEIHPLGLALTTRGAVEAFYRRMLPGFGSMKPTGDSATYGEAGSGRYIGRGGIITRDEVVFSTGNGEVPVRSMALFVFDEPSGLLKGEHIFLNANAARLFEMQLGPDFATLPGVLRLPGLADPA